MSNLIKIETRKIVPVAARISAGKSKLLNVIYNINFLECTAGIGTKFINLLRYNPNRREPCFFHLIILREGENYNFYIDKKEFYEGEEKIIEANKNINKKLKNEKEIKYENIFYMTEINDVPFIEDKEYLLTHDLCDVPGLTEYQKTEQNKKKEHENEQKNETKKNINKDTKDINDNTNNINDYLQMVELSDYNEKEEDDLFQKTKDIEKNTYLSEIFGIIKNYIDGAIIIFSVENYYFDDNFDLIAKLHRVIEKEITNFLVILNKIDLSTNPEEDIEKCKGEIISHFPKCQTFNINLNTFIPLSINQVKNELLMDKNFRFLIYYHFYNYMMKINRNKQSVINNSSFLNHLRDIIRIDIINQKITKNYIKKKVNQLNQQGDISKINNELSSIIKDLKKEFEGKDINFDILEDDFNKENEDDDDEEDNEENGNNDNNLDDLSASFIIKFLYIYFKEKKLIPSKSEETKKLLDYFSSKKKRFKFEKKNTAKKNMQLEINLHLLIDKLKKIEANKIQSLLKEIIECIEFISLSNYIFIPFLGPSNAGKTSIINGIIGKDVLPTDLKECTKRGIIIRYCDECDDDITIYKSYFSTRIILKETHYYLREGNIIGKGLEQVKEILKGLNYEFTDKEEDCFYFIKTKIQLFDELGLNDSLKRKIYLIDFPGYGTKNNFMENQICKQIISISSCFNFVVRNSIINENNTKEIIDEIFNLAKVEKKKLISGIIKSCSFILNNDNSQETTENVLESAKKDIKKILDKENNIIDDNSLNLCFFNAKYFCDYCNEYEYFFNLEKTFESEKKNFYIIKLIFLNIQSQLEKKHIRHFMTFYIIN